MIEVVQTSDFEAWLTKLKDLRIKARIIRRLDRLAQGNPGDVRPIGKGLSELRSMWARATASTTDKTGTR